MIRQAAISAVAFVRSTAARRVARGYPMIRSPMNEGKGAVVGGIRVREMWEIRGQRLVRIGRRNRSLWYIWAARLQNLRRLVPLDDLILIHSTCFRSFFRAREWRTHSTRSWKNELLLSARRPVIFVVHDNVMGSDNDLRDAMRRDSIRRNTAASTTTWCDKSRIKRTVLCDPVEDAADAIISWKNAYFF